MTDDRLAETVREALSLAYDPPSESHSALDSILARLDAVTKELARAEHLREHFDLAFQAAEADAEKLAQAAREFIGTTSASRQPTVSRHEFDQLCAALAARSKPS